MRQLRSWASTLSLPWLTGALITANLLGFAYSIANAAVPVWAVDPVVVIAHAVGFVWTLVLVLATPWMMRFLGAGEQVRCRLVAGGIAMIGLFLFSGVRSSINPEFLAGLPLSLLYNYTRGIWALLTLLFMTSGLVALAQEIRRLRFERDNLQVVLHFGESVSLMGKDGILRETVKVVRQMTAADACLLFLVDPEADVLRVAEHFHNPNVYTADYIDRMVNFPCPRGFGLTGRVMETGEPYLSKDVDKDTKAKAPAGERSNPKTILLLPMKVQGRLIGVLRVSKMGVDQFSDAQVTMCAILANHAAVALDAGNLYHEVLKASRTDPLTSLGNARAFREALEQAVKDQEPFALLMVDADCLKLVNDTFGHHAGDQLLTGLAGHLTEAAEGLGQAYRYAGDEFLVLLGGSSRDAARAVAERVRTGLAEMYMVSETGSVQTTVSIGVACYPADGGDPETVMQAADRAMYTAKQSGKNQVALAS